jgi:hypothetical protein
MDSKYQEDQMWELSTNTSRSERHSSLASSSSRSADDRQGSPNPDGTKSRRMRPSVSSASSQLPTVREQKEFRVVSWEKESREAVPPPQLKSEESVVSSKDVLKDFRKVAARDPERERRRQEKMQKYRVENQGQHAVYSRLKQRVDFDIRRMKSWLPWLTWERRPPLPGTDELLALARHYYPPRVCQSVTCPRQPLQLLTQTVVQVASSCLRFRYR